MRENGIKEYGADELEKFLSDHNLNKTKNFKKAEFIAYLKH